MVIYLRMEKTYTANTPPDDFKVTTPENPLLSKQVVTNKGIPVPYTNLQLNPYPNTQLDLFCNDNLSFQCTAPSTWLTMIHGFQYMTNTPTWGRYWLQSSSVHSTMKIKKLLGYKTLGVKTQQLLQRMWWTRAILSLVTICVLQQLQQPFHYLWRSLK